MSLAMIVKQLTDNHGNLPKIEAVRDDKTGNIYVKIKKHIFVMRKGSYHKLAEIK